MANAPTHPPNRSHNGGSPPKGPRRMTRHHLTAAETRERLTALSGHLKEPSPETKQPYTDAEFAEAVDAVLAPRGSELLRRSTSSGPRINMALYMASTVKAALEAKARAEAKAEAKETGTDPRPPYTVLGEVVDEGFERFLRGEFTPERPLKKPRGKGPEITKGNLNARADQALRDRVRELCSDKSVELGWTVTPGMVAMSWLFSEYGITEDDQIGVTVPEAPAGTE